jgi:hypothetical protein
VWIVLFVEEMWLELWLGLEVELPVLWLVDDTSHSPL